MLPHPEPDPISDPALRLGPQLCGDLEQASRREWLVADGTGGYAMGTVGGLRTRRYHGLLAPAERSGARRWLAVAALDPVLLLPSGPVRLGVHEWADGTVAPTGHVHLERFELRDGLPSWRWRVGEVVIERELALAYGSPLLAVTHRVLAGAPVQLAVEVLGTWRDVHGERHGDGDLPTETTADGAVLAGRYRVAGPGWSPTGEWFRGVHAREEAARGLPAEDDLWFAGRFTATLGAGDVLPVTAWASSPDGPALDRPAPDAATVIAGARARAREVCRTAGAGDPAEASLALAADAMVTTTPDVVAGYPWFGAWSRDTMVSYEGLLLETGRAETGRALLAGYAATLSEGMLANTADGVGAQPSSSGDSGQFNSVDATLWFVHAVGRHVARTGDRDLAVALAPALEAVVAAYRDGTRYGIRADSDGLVTQGEPGVALTWMDARVDGVGVTARIGKPVEIQALWVAALATVARVRQWRGADPSDLLRLRQSALTSFAARFPTGAGWWHDVVDGPAGDDPTLRPNQVIAMALPGGPGPDRAALHAAGAALLTPLGLRSLAPAEAGYRGVHRGDQRTRDAAYHQGTVWPWLIGPYLQASLLSGSDPQQAAGLLAGLEVHLNEWGLGSVSETADGDAPHAATGAPFQAWSVAELLRARRLLRGWNADGQPAG